MKDVIKKSFIWWLVFLFTVIIWSIVYAWIVWNVTSGQTLTADMLNNLAWNYNYSLSEVSTWKKWIDWKPIYRKVINLWDLRAWVSSNNTWRTNALNLDSPDVLVNSNINFSWMENVYTFFVTNTSQLRYYTDKLNFNYAFAPWWEYFFTNVVITVEYTKTTD